MRRSPPRDLRGDFGTVKFSRRPVTPRLVFDPHRRAASADLKQHIDALTAFLEAHEGRARRRGDVAGRKFRLAVEVIACNLLAADMLVPGAVVEVQRSHAVMFGRYALEVYGRPFLAALDVMTTLGLIEAETGFRISPTFRSPSIIAPTQSLAEHLPIGRSSWPELGHDASGEVIVLKGEKQASGGVAPLLDYRDTRETRRMRREVHRLNAYLSAAPVMVEATIDSDGQAIDPTRRRLVRIFNVTWRRNGRLSPGFWTNLPREDRLRLIRIGGEQIANVDWSELVPRLAYARAGVEQPPPETVYNLDREPRNRAGWKALVNAMLFAERPLRNWPRETRALFGAGAPSLREAVALIEQHHAPIAHLFGTGLGLELLRTESDMMMDVALALFDRGVSMLPLYDGALVGRSHAEETAAVMREALELRTGLRGVQLKIQVS